MKKLLSLVIVAGALALVGCASAPTATGQPPELARIKAACSGDALIRPSVNALLAVPGLAKPADILLVRGAQGVIDRGCANPSVDVQQAIADATGQIIAIYAELKARRAAAGPD